MQPSGTILAYVVEGHHRNISVKLFENWFIGLRDFSSGSHLVYRKRKILSILVGSQLGSIPVKSESNCPKSVGGETAFKAKYFRCSIFSSGGHFVHRSGTVLAVLIEFHHVNIPRRFE